ncbi:MAG: hypothetical protein WAU41_00095 [Gaiellaceae bacterium]
MKAGVLIAIVLLGGATVSGAATRSPATPTRVATCLAKHKLLTYQSTVRVVPKGSPQLGALQFSFALVPSQALNNGFIAFEKSAEIAKRVGTAFLKAEQLRFARNHVHASVALIQTTYFVENNAFIGWSNDPGAVPPGRTRARATLVACLR